jgi:hypothetical protein
MLYLLPQKITAIEYGGISAKVFFNMTNRMKMKVGDVLSLADVARTDLKDFITALIPGGPSSGAFEQLIPLFQQITLQERKAGVMFQNGFVKGPFSLQLATSLQVGERNFWLSKRDQEMAKQLFGDDTADNKKELYKIAAGLGDTRVKFGLNTLNMTSFQNDLGISFILPTSKLTQSEKINLGQIQVVFDAVSSDALKNEAIRSLKAVRDYLLKPRLGNNGHFAIGCYAEQKIGLFHDFMHLWVGASYDIFMPNEEERLFLFKQTLKASDVGALVAGHPGSPQEAENNRKVTDYIRQYVLPSSFEVTVKPGDVTNFVLALVVDWNDRWRSTWGYDFYAQRRTAMRRLHNTGVDINDLRTEDEFSAGDKVYAYQHKYFSETMYRVQSKRTDIGIGLGGDMTVSSRRTGEDWTVYFKVAVSF